MDIVIEPEGASRPALSPVEIVERKGLGHPDSLCDALAEEASLALGRFYLDRFGAVLHHNLDKALLHGGRARAAFGGGEVTEPIELYIAGRAVLAAKGVAVPASELVHEAVHAWLGRHMHALDPARHLRLHCLLRPGSTELAALFEQGRGARVPLANDSSIGAGFAPLTPTEAVVLAVERRLNAPETRRDRPAVGEDVKVMAVRRGERVELTVADALIGGYLKDRDDYRRHKTWIAEVARTAAAALTPLSLEVAVNTADGDAVGGDVVGQVSPDDIYLTVTGTSAEAGDDGQVGRGNRANGLIAPYRPMTMEAVAGKNPISHVGKLYNLAAGLLAEAIVAETPEVAAADCFLVSRIGRPIDRPQTVHVRLALASPAGTPPPGVAEIVRREVAGIGGLWRELMAGTLRFDRWPLRGG